MKLSGAGIAARIAATARALSALGGPALSQDDIHYPTEPPHRLGPDRAIQRHLDRLLQGNHGGLRPRRVGPGHDFRRADLQFGSPRAGAGSTWLRPGASEATCSETAS